MAIRNEQKGDDERGDRPYQDIDDEMLKGEIARLQGMVLVAGSQREMVLKGLRAEYAVRMAEASRGVTGTSGGRAFLRPPERDMRGLPDMTDSVEIVEREPAAGDKLRIVVGGAEVDADDFRSRLIKALQSDGFEPFIRDAAEAQGGPFDDNLSGIDDAPSEMPPGPRRGPPPIPPHER